MERQLAIIGFVSLGILAVAIVFWANGDCSKHPLWWESHNERLDEDLDASWEKIGSKALHVKVRCRVSSVGMHGHLGGYFREIQPLEIVSVGPARGCR